MVGDEAKAGILEWLFGKKSLEKAAQTDTPKPIPAPPPQNNDYVKQQVEKMEMEKKNKQISKPAMDKLKKVQ